MSSATNTNCSQTPCRDIDCAVFFDDRNGRFYIKVMHLGCNTRANNGRGYSTAEEAKAAVAKIKAASDRRSAA